MDPETPVLDAHRARLTAAFGRDVAALDPRSLLDVGCGGGLLLALLQGLGIPLQGVDLGPHRLAQARERGLEVREADARALPFADGAVDWVVLRHVLHHLEDPAGAVREAWRVAGSGVVLSEPGSDATIPSQGAMARFDSFRSELLARTGHIHHPYLSAGELIALVPGATSRIEIRSYGELTPVPEAEARALGLEATPEPGAVDARRLEEFVRLAAAGDLSYTGSVAVFVRRGGGPAPA